MNQIDRQSESLFHREKTRLQFYMANVYGWMSVSLLLTAFVSFYMIRNEKIIFFMSTNRWVLLVVFLVEIFLVNFLTSSVLRKIDGDSVTTLLMLYSLLTGITISLPLFIYTSFSIVSTFFISSIMFGSLSVYGYKTKTSLSAFSSFLFMSIVGIITASFLNMLIGSSTLNFFITCLGILTFSGLAAYDSQKLKEMGSSLFSCENSISKDVMRKHSIVGALTLYLDFINIFLVLLQINGERK